MSPESRTANHKSCTIFFILLTLLVLACTPALWAEDDPRRPSAIEVEDVPPVPEPLWELLRQYQNVRGAAFSGWHPEGNGILIRTRFGNTAQLHRVYEPAGRREQISFYDEPVRGTFIPGTEDGAILLSMSDGGDENYQVHFRSGDGRRTVRLTDGVSRNSLGPIREDGRQAVISSNQRNGRDTDLYILDPRRPDSMERVLTADGQFWYAADWSPDGQTLLIGRFVSVNESYPALLDLQSGEITELPLPTDEIAGIGSMQFSPDGNSVYLATDTGSEFRQLNRLDLKEHTYTILTDDIPWDVESLDVDRDSGRLAFVVNADGISELYVLDGNERRRIDLPLGIVSSLEFSPDGEHLGLTLSRPDAPSDAYSVRLADGKVTRWTYSEVGGLDPDSFVTAELVRFPSFDDLSVPAFVYRPEYASADRPAPVLVSIHGGPESQYRPYFSSATQFYVNELGMAVVGPNVRGSRGYGKTYLKLDNAMLREDAVRDIGALLDWIAEQPELDETRVAVVGGSYGGYMVLASLIHFGDRLRAGINIVGIANFITFLENTAPYRQDLRRVEYGDERDPEMRAFFEQINPTSNAHRIRSALLVAHGKNDPRVPFSEAQQIAAAVREQDRSVWTVYADNEGHGFARRDNADYLRAVQAMFLIQHMELDAPLADAASGGR